VKPNHFSATRPFGATLKLNTTITAIDHKPQKQGWWYPYPDEWFYEAAGRKHV